jgi:hypothetical protein
MVKEAAVERAVAVKVLRIDIGTMSHQDPEKE